MKLYRYKVINLIGAPFSVIEAELDKLGLQGFKVIKITEKAVFMEWCSQE